MHPHPYSPAAVADFDQNLAKAEQDLVGAVALYRETAAQIDEVSNVTMLYDELAKLTPNALSALLAAAIRRLALADDPA